MVYTDYTDDLDSQLHTILIQHPSKVMQDLGEIDPSKNAGLCWAGKLQLRAHQDQRG